MDRERALAQIFADFLKEAMEIAHRTKVGDVLPKEFETTATVQDLPDGRIDAHLGIAADGIKVERGLHRLDLGNPQTAQVMQDAGIDMVIEWTNRSLARRRAAGLGA